METNWTVNGAGRPREQHAKRRPIRAVFHARDERRV